MCSDLLRLESGKEQHKKFKMNGTMKSRQSGHTMWECVRPTFSYRQLRWQTVCRDRMGCSWSEPWTCASCRGGRGGCHGVQTSHPGLRRPRWCRRGSPHCWGWIWSCRHGDGRRRGSWGAEMVGAGSTAYPHPGVMVWKDGRSKHTQISTSISNHPYTIPYNHSIIFFLYHCAVFQIILFNFNLSKLSGIWMMVLPQYA